MAQLRDVSEAVVLCMGREVFTQADTLLWAEQAGCSNLGFVCHMMLAIYLLIANKDLSSSSNGLIAKGTAGPA